MATRPPKWPFWLLGVWFVLATVYLKVYTHSRQEFRKAESYLKKGEMHSAIRHYAWSIRWYTPGNRYVRVAIKRLLRIGEHAYQRGDWEQAISAYQHTRNALNALRTTTQPHKTTLHLCEKRLAQVLVQLSPSRDAPRASKGKEESPQEKKIKQILSSLQVDARPSGWTSIWLLIGYIVWLFWGAFICLRWEVTGSCMRILACCGMFGGFFVWFASLWSG